jgi:hypothetical protein
MKPYTPKDKICAWCGRPFRAAAKARYCSDACKMKAYRARKARKGVTL